MVLIQCIRIPHSITRYNIKICDAYGGSVLQCVIWGHNERVIYFSSRGPLRKQDQIISHYSQYSLTQSQKLTICLTRGNIYTNINIVNPKNSQEKVFESFLS